MTTKDLLFETFVNVPQKETFLIKTANAQEFPISIKSFDSDISNFDFDEELNKISYETSFDEIVIKVATKIAEKILHRDIENKAIIQNTLRSAVKKILGANEIMIKINLQFIY